MKVCSRCKRKKSPGSFSWKYRALRVKHPECITCKRKYNNRYYKRNRGKYKERTENSRKSGAQLIRETKDRPCADCGVKYPSYVMDFDHVRGEKKFDISNSGYHSCKNKLINEISKCDVVCANCHRERTYGPKSLRLPHRPTTGPSSYKAQTVV